MAWRSDGTTDELSISSGFPNVSPLTMMGWFYITAMSLDVSSIMEYVGADSYMYVRARSGGDTLSFYSLVNGNSSGSALSTGIWYHIALTNAGAGSNNALVYLNGTLNISAKGMDSSIFGTPSILRYNNSQIQEYWNGRSAAIKIWESVLTPDQILQEMDFYTPITNYPSLYCWTPGILSTDLLDHSGGVHNWTAGGTLVEEDGPPIAWEPRQTYVGFKSAVSAGVVSRRLLRGVGR
jgi:hypothetical protein